MSAICWLQLSDWHQKGPDLEADRAFVRNKLIEDIAGRANLNSALSHLDLVVFSGDLAFAGKDQEYRTAGTEFLDPILKAADVTNENLVLVPGNHDLDQDELRYLAPFLTLLKDRDGVNDALSTPASRQKFLRPMQSYVKFCNSYLPPSRPPLTPDPAYSQLREFSAGGRRVAILGLNSAWMCGQNKQAEKVNDYGYLILGEPQLNQDFDRWKTAEIRLAVMHHPFEWFSTVEDRSRLRRALTRSCHFLLRGHEHDSEVSVPAAGTAGSYAVFSAGAAYDRRDGQFRPNGYNFVYLDLDQGQGTVYLRRYDSEQRKFIADSSATGDETPGIASFVLPADLARPRSTAPKPPAEALVGDLWAVQNPVTMKNIAEIYRVQHAASPVRRIEATLVVQANSLRDESEPDLVTLEQTFEPVDDPVYCIKLSIFSSSGDFLGQSKWRLYDNRNRLLRTIALPTYEPAPATSFTSSPGSSPQARSLVIHFDPVLRPGAGYYRLEYKEWVRNGMARLRSGRDELFLSLSRGIGVTPRVNLVLKSPEAFGTVEMEPSPKNSSGNVGEPMDPQEIGHYDDIPDFLAIGWKGTNVGGAEVFAVDVVKR